MSPHTHPNNAHGVPRIELRHRLNLALEYAGISNDEIADHLGKSTTTVRNYLSGRTTPDRSTCRDWAMRCGVQLDWVLYGIEAPAPSEPDGPRGVESGRVGCFSGTGGRGTPRTGRPLPDAVVIAFPLADPLAA